MMIEQIEAVHNLEEILELKEVDAILVGLNDLAASVGRLGYDDHPEMNKIYDVIAEKTKKAGKPLGVALRYNEKNIKDWLNRGANFFSIGADYAYLTKIAQSELLLAKKINNG
jgi:4-hydroxy-2-oxoheptanedioate aldolase